MVSSKARRPQLARLAISFVTQDIQDGSSFLLFKLECLTRSHEVSRLLRAQRAEGWRLRWPSWSCGARCSSWSQRFCFGPGSLLRDHRYKARLVVSCIDRLGTTFPSRSHRWGSVHRDYCAAQEVRP